MTEQWLKERQELIERGVADSIGKYSDVSLLNWAMHQLQRASTTLLLVEHGATLNGDVVGPGCEMTAKVIRNFLLQSESGARVLLEDSDIVEILDANQKDHLYFNGGKYTGGQVVCLPRRWSTIIVHERKPGEEPSAYCWVGGDIVKWIPFIELVSMPIISREEVESLDPFLLKTIDLLI